MPEDVALPGLAFKTPDPERTPDAVCDVIPDLNTAPSLETVPDGEISLFGNNLAGLFRLESRFPISFPFLEKSAVNKRVNK